MSSEAAEQAHGIAFAQPLILLAAMVVGVALSRRLGLGSVIGYLAAGVLIGPVARLVTDSQDILKVAELGVVMFLFVVGLELKPQRLWAMRRDIFGLGLAQVVLTGFLLTAVFHFAGLATDHAIIVGFGLAMSSTALCMQILAERGELTTDYGQKAVAVLLFQDIAIVPLLALVPVLAPGGSDFAASGFGEIVKIVVALAALILAGRFLLNPLFRLLALTNAREVMIAAALLVVLGSAELMDYAGMSMAMGAFIAGLMLADSAFRHELEANVEPFRSILLGLFFLAVGMSIDLDTILRSWQRVMLAVAVVMTIKAAAIYGLARLFRASHDDAVRLALLLPQAGEFAFVLFATAAGAGALLSSETSFAAGVVTISMALTPFAVMLGRFLIRETPAEAMEEDFEGAGGRVLIVGFGRFGQVVAQTLVAQHVPTTIIDANPERIRQAAQLGSRIYFGDGTRRDVLRAAGADEAAIICVCVETAETTSHVVEIAVAAFPNARIYARAWDRVHALELLRKGVDYELRETYESALAFGAATLRGLGLSADEVDGIVAEVRRREDDRVAQQLTADLADGRGRTRPREAPLASPAAPAGGAAE